jgi:hypothetical protein
MSNTAKREVTAREVREFYRADAKRLARLSDEAALTVAPGARGRLHPEVEQDHNSRRRNAVYVLGKTAEVSAKAKEDAAALRAAALKAGFKVGARGPLPKAFLSKG